MHGVAMQGSRYIDTHNANYTLLGFVEHMGTMRSGHYVAYVQRGLNVSDSPHLLSLLQKHGMAAAPEANSSRSITSPAVGRAKKKGSAAKASSSSSLRQAVHWQAKQWLLCQGHPCNAGRPGHKTRTESL